MIRTLDQIEEMVLNTNKKHRVAVAWAHDTNTLGALNKAVKNGLIEAILIGIPSEIRKTCKALGIVKHSLWLNRTILTRHLMML